MYKVDMSELEKKPFVELEQRIVDLPRFLEDKALEQALELEQSLARIYETAPPRDDSRFVWSLDPAANKRARGWWWANLKEGNIPTDGKHYKRQGTPPYGVRVNLSQAQYSVTFQIVMTNRKMLMVFGALNGEDTRLPSHKNTGWAFASPLVDKAVADARDALSLKIAMYLESI